MHFRVGVNIILNMFNLSPVAAPGHRHLPRKSNASTIHFINGFSGKWPIGPLGLSMSEVIYWNGPNKQLEAKQKMALKNNNSTS
jgi:hypothetical protein